MSPSRSPAVGVPTVIPASRPASRSVRVGAGLIAVGVVQFSAAMAVVQYGFPGYSDLTNYISDLGNSAISPWYWVFNVSIILLGVLAFCGILLAWSGFPPGGTRVVGLLLLLVASVSAIFVGIFPENVNINAHVAASFGVFAPGGIALVVLGSGLRPGTDWHWFRWVSITLGLITLVSLAYFAPTQTSNTTFDPGFIERLIVYPILIWGFLAALQLWRAPPATRGAAGS